MKKKEVLITVALILVVMVMAPAICRGQVDSSWWVKSDDGYVNIADGIIAISVTEFNFPYDVAWGKKFNKGDNNFVFKFTGTDEFKARVRICHNAPPWNEYYNSGVINITSGYTELAIDCQGAP
ncbi:MAG: hypothetical protein ABIB72_04155, partial [Candidatus Falkowbacteria bacterium]